MDLIELMFLSLLGTFFLVRVMELLGIIESPMEVLS